MAERYFCAIKPFGIVSQVVGIYALVMQIIDGKQVAEKVLSECSDRIAALKEKGVTPGLAVVLVGEDPASKVYVGSKARKCVELGIYSRKIELPADSSQEEVMAVVEELNNDDKVHGILVQSPPPPHIDEEAIVRAINPAKDVDGFHPENVAKLALEDPTGFVPCTPAGCMRLLKEAGVETSGAEAVVIGRSMIVGKPMALLLMGKAGNATVTVAHSRTKDLAEVCRRADIIVAAIGKPEFVTADMVKDGATIIDVGINRVEDASKKSGYKLVGDVAYDECAPKCKAITPVPGGVGPMTIAMLMQNTVQAAEATL
ncbi:methylenetetrahydrofolate dehydrogenase (NADP+) / methenyltetrahydrofolate cyclohydrolase [Rubritalea squalenifaciens DSM 18772]|uniref:Bifunctional protein FolD n=2 Tax=Rubritalea squalenifaciens TaxID=407226 RepID=A0A1M6L5X1_9BACT|nr:methylenetetrahydrofolate dehydrogenase (NADP+) / methenyltetrahydrofolate cyclohydrolase [Rubritalea squalenifaciens DSM 18772]